ncbi:MAG: FtsX-like permease family protein [bacterium]
MIVLLLGIIAVVVGIVLFDAYRHKILFRIGCRNIFRRKTNTVIVILGLMIATAIISSSFGVGDTMDNMVEDEIYSEWQQTDVTVYNTTVEGNYVPIQHSTYKNLSSDISDIDNVDEVSGEVHGSLPVLNPDARLSQPSTRVIGMDLDDGEAFGRFYKDGESFEPELGEKEIFIDTRLAEELEAEKGDELLLFTVESQEEGGNGVNDMTYTVKEVIDNEGRAAFRGSNKIIMSLSDAQTAFSLPNQVNYIRVTSIGGVESGIEYSDQIFEDIENLLQEDPEYNVLEAKGNKNQVLQDFKDNISQFTDIFLIFGTFSIIAGIILAVNIFVMLGEERKSEMGMSRAIGMKRGHLRRVFSYEGMIYAGAASFVGVFVGAGLTYVIFFLLEDIFATFGGDVSLLGYFTFTPESMILAFAAGFLLTMGTIFFSVTRISKLNIVRAIRDIPEPPVSKKNKKVFYMAIAGLILGVLLTIMGTGVDQFWLPVTGISLIIIGIGTVARRWVGDRAAYTGVGVFLLVWWLVPLDTLEFFEGYTSGLEMFILSGLFMVTAGVLIVMLNGHLLTGGMERLCRSDTGFKAVVLSAISHPLKEKFRTGMTIFIFALIIFAITVMGMIVGIFDTNIDRMIEEESGGYEIMGMTGQDKYIDDMHSEIINNENLDIEDFNHIDSAYRGNIRMRDNDGEIGRKSAIGIDDNFVGNNTFGFSDYLDEYESNDEVWDAVLSNSSLVITNAPSDQYGPPGGETIELGSTVKFIDHEDEVREKKVVGFMDQNAISGYFMSKGTVRNEFNITSNSLFFFSVEENVDADELGRDLNREFIQYGFRTVVIETIIRDAMSATYMFFDLFSGYMGLGLVVGIAGLGIISLRAVHERRLEIGMMRAIGFKRKMIRYAFLIENSFITIVGIVLGSSLGIAIGWLLWYDGFKPMGWEFSIPWISILTIGVIAYVAMLLTAIPSAHKASKVSPAEALRFD